VNNTGCDIILCLYSTTSASYCQSVPNGIPTVLTLPAGFTPKGVKSHGGISYPFVPPLPQSGCTPCISLTTTGLNCARTVCATVCTDVATCQIVINNCPSPCNP
jgi:hypothetical protein